MKFAVTLVCEHPDCPTDRETMPSGEFSDMRIGRAHLEAEAVNLGWKKVRPTIVMINGQAHMRQVVWLCANCARKGKIPCNRL